MKKLLALAVIVIAVFLLFLPSCGSDKNSNEACLHETSLNLDKGDYDAVIGSACADDMQLGAAWFGKAGFDITNVINRFVDANSSSSQKTDLNIYMTALIGTVTDKSLTYLDNARAEYASVPDTDSGYLDAQFYSAIVDALKSMSLIKIAVPNVVTIAADGTSTLNTACDDNSNNVPDDADATACELIAVTNIENGGSLACNGAQYSPASPSPTRLTDPSGQPISGTFSGLIVTMTTGTNPDTSGCNPAGTTTYKRLLYQDPTTSQWAAATTTEEMCDGSNGQQWPCPATGQNMNLTSAIDISLYNSVTSLNSSVTGTDSDVQASINEFYNQACTSSCSTVCSGAGTLCPASCQAGATTYCSAEDISNYIETNLQ